MHSIYADGFMLNVLERGMGMPVLLVHGFPLDHRMWQEQTDALATRFRVIAPDLRGFGDSRGASGTTTMFRFADDLRIVLDQLGVVEPVAVCGLSMGGYITFEFWRRFAARVGSLIFCDTKAAPDAPEAADGRRTLADRTLANGIGDLADMLIPKLLGDSTRAGRLDIVDRIRETINAADPAAVAAALRGMAERSDSRPDLPTINVPTLVIVGKEDTLTPPSDSREIADGIPGAKLVEIPAAGHMSPMEQPAAVTEALLGFLK